MFAHLVRITLFPITFVLALYGAAWGNSVGMDLDVLLGAITLITIATVFVGSVSCPPTLNGINPKGTCTRTSFTP